MELVRISDKAAEYIRSNGGSVYLVESPPVMLFWCRADMGPSVRLGIPGNPENYVLYSIKGIDVYVSRRVYIPRVFTIGLTNYLLFKSLSIEDWKLI